MAFALVIPKVTGTDMLAFQRRDDKAPTDPNVLGLFGGSIEGDETPVEAAYRELQEETSLDMPAEAFTFVTQTEMPTLKGMAEVHLFIVEIPDAPFETYEGTGYELHSREAFLAREDISKGAAHILRTVTL